MLIMNFQVKGGDIMDIASIIQQYCIPIIVAVCYCICFGIKKTELVKNKYLPIISIVLGGISGILMNGFSYEAIALGICSGAAATGVHQIFKQLSKDEDYTI